MTHYVLPNFLVVGAPKSGTTSLYYYLRQHGQIFLPKRKELHYFSHNLLYANSNGPGDRQVLDAICHSREEYAGYYAGVAPEQVAVGEISPSYLYYCEAAEQIAQELGAVRIIMLLRNPIEKAYSQYLHQVLHQSETLSFEQALNVEAERAAQGWSDMWRYAESSIYAARVRCYLERFGRENVLPLFFEDFVRETEQVMCAVFGFLGVDAKLAIKRLPAYNATGQPRSRLFNRLQKNRNILKSLLRGILPEEARTRISLFLYSLNTKRKSPMAEDTRQRLRAYFGRDVAELEQVVGRRAPWKDFSDNGEVEHDL